MYWDFLTQPENTETSENIEKKRKKEEKRGKIQWAAILWVKMPR